MEKQIDLTKFNDKELIAIHILDKWSEIAFDNIEKVIRTFSRIKNTDDLMSVHFCESTVKFNFLMDDGATFVDSFSLNEWIDFVRVIENENVDATTKNSM